MASTCEKEHVVLPSCSSFTSTTALNNNNQQQKHYNNNNIRHNNNNKIKRKTSISNVQEKEDKLSEHSMDSSTCSSSTSTNSVECAEEVINIIYFIINPI